MDGNRGLALGVSEVARTFGSRPFVCTPPKLLASFATKEGLRRLAAGKRAADPLAPLVRAQTPAEIFLLADSVVVDVLV